MTLLSSARDFWAKTVDDQPGISVRDHCMNVGCVAEVLLASLPATMRKHLPNGSATLAALHDVGKISAGFQVKCPVWVARQGLNEAAQRERWRPNAEKDHARVSQHFLQMMMKPAGTHLWGVAPGVHHGRIFGRRISQMQIIPGREEWLCKAREELLAELINVFGPLPSHPPEGDLAALWCVAGMISVADWIGSNEAFFPSDRGLTLEQSREAAERALTQIHWHGGGVRSASFAELFDGKAPLPLQGALHQESDAPGLLIVEGPMGCGKTEAALWAAHRLIESGVNDGIYFALPTQVTSNRIHLRVAPFLRSALVDAANLRLAHSASWLDDHQTWLLRPSASQDADAAEHVREGRSWFASSKHALLARYGVGTVDQALQGVVAVKHFFVRRFGLAGKVVILDEVHSYDVYTGTLITRLIKELLALHCSVIVLSATLTQARRQELIAAAGGDTASATSSSYPLLTVVRPGVPVVETPVEATASRSLKLKTTALSEAEIIGECIRRAEAGQHVLYLRNTVAEAQGTCRVAFGSVRGDRVEVGLLHGRFPFFRRQELEDEWLGRLGRHRVNDGKGSILIATQVVEQSVDIDLDFIVSDLAPTDMLLQRMGRLWRHERADRLASVPEFWINAPLMDRDANAKELKKAFGKSGYVYAPYVLLRTAEVFEGRETIILPDQIREVMEATYAERTQGEEPSAWHELRVKVEKEREHLASLAEAVTRVLGHPPADDDKELLTRRKGAPTRDVVLLRACELVSRDQWRITPLHGKPLDVSGYDWSIAAARALHRNLVRAPLHTVPRQTMPPWLLLHTHGFTAWALVQHDGSCLFPDAEGPSALAYHPTFGLHTQPGKPQPHYAEDDDELDS